MIVSAKSNIIVPGHFLEDWLRRSWAGVDYGSKEGSTHVNVKPMHFLELLESHTVRDFALKKTLPRPLKVPNSKGK